MVASDSRDTQIGSSVQSSALHLDCISKSYKDGSEMRTILNEVSLSLGQGEFAAIVGPSGSGKSTLLTIAGMLLSPDSGRVFIAGEDMSWLRQRDWTRVRREHLGFVFQNHQLLPYLKAKDQLYVGRDKKFADSAMDVEQLLKDLGVHSTDQYPQRMSGGERQRVAIARAFANDPDVILADEPTASLDGDRGRQVVELIRNQVHARNKAALMVTHDERVLDLVDRTYRLEDGRLVPE